MRGMCICVPEKGSLGGKWGWLVPSAADVKRIFEGRPANREEPGGRSVVSFGYYATGVVVDFSRRSKVLYAHHAVRHAEDLQYNVS